MPTPQNQSKAKAETPLQKMQSLTRKLLAIPKAEAMAKAKAMGVRKPKKNKSLRAGRLESK